MERRHWCEVTVSVFLPSSLIRANIIKTASHNERSTCLGVFSSFFNANHCDCWCVSNFFSFLIFFFFVSAVSHPKQKSLVASRKDGFLIIFCIFCFPLPPMHCCCIWNMSWFWASQIKANALIYCHRYCNSVIHTSSTSADFQPFKWRIMAYGRFWSASPAGEENQLIFRAHLFCVDPKLSWTWTFLFFFPSISFFFFFLHNNKAF